MSEKKFLITEDGSHTLFIPELNETYHSIHGAIQESNHVYIRSGLEYYFNKEKTNEVKIFEVGFGTGLNALLSAIYAEKHRFNINYESIEAYPLTSLEVEKLNYPHQVEHIDAVEIFNKIHNADWNSIVSISSYFKLNKIKNLLQNHHFNQEFDLCFFDAFAPSKQPEMWEREILEPIYNGLITGGVFVTYCAKGQLKRDLKDIGFEIDVLPGPPGKLQMLRGTKI